MEKNYIIWLKSGLSVEGSLPEPEAQRLMDNFVNKSTAIEKYCSDFDKVAIDMSQVDAVAINSQVEENVIGFNSVLC